MKRLRTVPGPLLLLFAAACAAAASPWTARELRAAEDAPVQFVTDDGTTPEDGCRSPLIDPRDQTRIRLIRSAAIGSGFRGDYDVPDGRYGVRAGELLRIDCASGQALGIVAS